MIIELDGFQFLLSYLLLLAQTQRSRDTWKWWGAKGLCPFLGE